MVNDFYAEYLVAKRPTGGDRAKQALIGLGTALLGSFCFLLLFPLGVMIAALVFYGGYYLITGVETEYEYIVSNGDLDIDKVIGRRKRKRLITAPINTVTAFGKLSDAPEEPDGCTLVLASDGTSEEFFCDFVHKSAGNVRIIFTPSEKIIEGVGVFLPRQLKAEFLRKFPKKKKTETETESE